MACEDPSNVGVGLVGDQGGEAINIVHDLTAFEPEEVDYVTGNATRMLIGSVVDPVLGQMSTTAYVDFIQSGSYTSTFRGGPVKKVEFHLVRDYIYGDTTSTMTIRLYDMPAEWESTGAKSDTSLTAGPVIGDFSFPANEDTLVFELPQAWVTANDAILRVDSVAKVFHGFKIEPVSNQAVVGYDVSEAISFLRIYSGTDSSSLYISKDINTITRDTPATIDENKMLIQNGFGTAAKVEFALSDSIVSVNRVLIQLQADTLTLKNTPPHFVRPIQNTLRMVGITEEGKVSATSGVLTIDVSGGLQKDGSFYFRTAGLNQVIQDMIMDRTDIKRFRLLPPTDNTLTPILLYKTTSSTQDPRIIFTVTPIN